MSFLLAIAPSNLVEKSELKEGSSSRPSSQPSTPTSSSSSNGGLDDVDALALDEVDDEHFMTSEHLKEIDGQAAQVVSEAVHDGIVAVDRKLGIAQAVIAVDNKLKVTQRLTSVTGSISSGIRVRCFAHVQLSLIGYFFRRWMTD